MRSQVVTEFEGRIVESENGLTDLVGAYASTENNFLKIEYRVSDTAWLARIIIPKEKRVSVYLILVTFDDLKQAEIYEKYSDLYFAYEEIFGEEEEK